MNRDILFGKQALEKLLKGLNLAADVVGATIGPKGRNSFISDPLTPKITNDGFTIAKNINLPDKQEDLGAYVIRNVAGQQNDDVGDGTTTVSVLTQAVIDECIKRPENPMEIKDSLNEAVKKIVDKLHKKSIKIPKEEIEKVALISSENPQLAKLIAEIITKLGAKPVINVEDAKTLLTEYEIVDGYETPVGFMSPHFINDKKAGKAIYNDILVLVTENKISNIADIAPIFEQFKKYKVNSCVIVCDDIDDSMLGMLVMNKVNGLFSSVVIKTGGETLRDIAGAVGATMVSSSTGITFQTLQIEHLGHAKKLVADANKTIFIGEGGASKLYATELERKLDNEPNTWLKKRLEERIARLRGGVAILRIAAPSDLEREYLKLKAEDAVKAVLAALEEGIVEGGGMALWRIAQEMVPKTIGDEVLKKALSAPLKRIVQNAGKDYAEIIKNLPIGQGYDAKKDIYVDMMQSGIIDPAKVERCALMNAVSAAATVITTYALITEHEEPKNQ